MGKCQLFSDTCELLNQFFSSQLASNTQTDKLLKSVLKGYLCYKTIRLRIFLFQSRIMLHCQDIQVFAFLTTPWFVTSSWVLVHETKYIFEYIFWTATHEVTKLDHSIDISNGNNSKSSFEQFGGLGIGSRPFSIYQPAPINQ